ncbi:MAG: electron transfer flavoprotein-ubiquinone oxidoreductase [Pseudomonadota bacterium]|nr:electron transfer flavoprotein-ubiquinone oxidoreductase [Pseudomonadota bacterium]
MAEKLTTDVLIVGAGPAGLAMAIRVKQRDPKRSVYILEKAKSEGNHAISGSVMDPSALDLLLPSWRQAFDEKSEVSDTRMVFLTEKRSICLPHLPHANHYGCYILSLSKLVRYMANEAKKLGVEIICGYTGKALLEDNGRVVGVKTGEFGLKASSEPGPNYQDGMEIQANHVVIAEGAYGYLAQKVIKRFSLQNQPMTYGLGVKEVWRVAPEVHQEGLVIHSVGWPLPSDTYGGGFIYHGPDHKIFAGMIVGLDAPNPTLNAFKSLQVYKHHPKFHHWFDSGEPIAYGARVINEGGYQSIPTLDFPGGVLIGCAAGFVNIVRIKGIHAAIYSGIEAADAWLTGQSFDSAFRAHEVVTDLYRARNVRPSFRYGLFSGVCLTAIDQYVFRGKAPYTFRQVADHLALNPKLPPISYPKPDHKISFDLLTMVQLTNTSHREGQPCHLVIKDASLPIKVNHDQYHSPEIHYCPANVYEVDNRQYIINHTNCIHCKACAIRDPFLNITWELPEGGGGPNYSET